MSDLKPFISADVQNDNSQVDFMNLGLSTREFVFYS